MQQEIVDEFGRSNKEVASKALFNMGAIHEIARRWPQAVDAYEEVIKRYPKMEVAVDALSAIGLIYESQTEFRKAAEAFLDMQQFRTQFKDKPEVAERAADAYRDAGVLYEALEEYDKANEVYEKYTTIYPKRDDVARVAFRSAEVLEYKETPEAYEAAAKQYEAVARKYGRADTQYDIRATAAAGLAYKKADKTAHRRKAEGLFKSALKDWEKLGKLVERGKVDKVDDATRGYAAFATFELAEYKYDDYAALTIVALNKRGEFDMGTLERTLVAKGEALIEAQKAFDKVLDFKDKGMAAAAAFRLGQIRYEFSESLFNAEVPPGLTPDQVDEYRFALEEFAAPIQEAALAAFTAALRQAVKDGVYNKWSRLSAVYAAKVNKDEFPLAEFTVEPDKTRDTVQSTSFIKAVRRGSTVVDYLRREVKDKDEEKKGTKDADDAEPGDQAVTKEAK